MKLLSKGGLVILFLLIATQSYAQHFKVEGAASWQKLTGSTEYSNDNVVYPSFGIGYLLKGHHSMWFTISFISGYSFLQTTGPTYGGASHVKAYPIGLRYQYRILADAPVTPYVKVSLLIIPITDKTHSDVVNPPNHSVNIGGNFGIGLKVKLINHLAIFGAVNYRLVKNSNGRSFHYIDIGGFWTQIGTIVSIL